MTLLLPSCAKAGQVAEPVNGSVSQLIARSEKQAQLFNAGRMQEWNALAILGPTRFPAHMAVTSRNHVLGLSISAR
jgi:hypothetical protein